MAAESDVLQGDVHPWFDLDKVAPHLFTAGRLRYLLRQRSYNGLAAHLVWVGRTPFIRESELARWLDEQREEARP